MKQYSTQLVSLSLLVAALFLSQWIPTRSNVRVIQNGLVNLPYHIDGFIGQRIPMEKSVERELNTDGYIFRNYINSRGWRVNLYIGYYGTKKGGRTGHNPNACYPSQGWAILEERRVKLEVPVGGNLETITVNEMLVKNQTSKLLVYHWYQSDKDDVLESGIAANLHRFKTMILYGRNEGAFIRVSGEVMGDEDTTRGVLRGFIKALFPHLVTNWPREG